jgi:hypothetical protein
MAKVGEVVSIFRSLIKEHSDDSAFEDQELYHILSSARALLFKRKADSFKVISAWEFQTFCIPLEKAFSHDCGCVTVGCKVLRSKYRIPRALTSRNKDLIRFSTLDHTEIPIMKERDIKTFIYDDVMKKSPFGVLIDRYIVIFNTDNRWRGILTSAIWEDLSEWDGIQLCDVDGGEADCFNFFDSEFSIDPDLMYPMYEMGLRMMNIPLRLQEDETNDTSNVIRI